MRRRPACRIRRMLLMAKFGVIVFEWMTRLDLDATAIQCWSSLQQNYGFNCCTIMSMMSEKLMPSACEVDVTGMVAMYAMQLASGKPSALVDWNNNYGDDPNKCVFFHCGNWAKAFLPDIRSAPRRSSGASSARRTPTARWTVARPAGPSRSAASRPTIGTAASRLRRRGPVHRRRAEDLRHPGRRRGAGAAEADARHLPARIRAPRRHERLTIGRRARRSDGRLPGLGGVRARQRDRGSVRLTARRQRRPP